MAHTDKTKPVRVRILEGTLTPREVHDHRTGPCDLPATPRDEEKRFRQEGWAGHQKANCYWDFHMEGTSTCGCHMCTSHNERRAERRANRHDTKRALTKERHAANQELAEQVK